jgi:predicted ester cyclase
MTTPAMPTNPPSPRTHRPPSVRERLGWRATPKSCSIIRRLWIDHSKAEDRRNLNGLIATLTEDCVYEIVPTGQRWVGHAGAREFYTSFLGAFPDVKFNLTDIVIGPQGVFEVATMTGTHLGPWNGIGPTGRAVRTTVLIFFPWDRRVGKFAGEKIYADVGGLVSGS